jgi:hypothetical protein
LFWQPEVIRTEATLKEKPGFSILKARLLELHPPLTLIGGLTVFN